MGKNILLIFLCVFGISGVHAQTLSPESEYGEVKFYDFDLSMKNEGGNTYFTWNKFEKAEKIKWWKLVYSQKTSNISYPENDAYFLGDSQTLTSAKQWFDEGDYYFRLCAITQDNNRYCGDIEKYSLKKSEEKPQICTMEYAPVCGKKDGIYKTYSNNCMREASGATKVEMKYCEQSSETPKVCTREYIPVCGKKDGLYKIYSNNCMRESSGAVKVEMKYCEEKLVEPKKDEISYQMSLKIKALINDFTKRLEAKNYSDEKVLSTIDGVIEKLMVLGKQDKYKAIVSYMVDLLKEYRSKYEDDFSIFDDIFGNY